MHLSFNIIGTLICLIPFCILDAVFDFSFTRMAINPFMIAVCHSIFNVVTTAVLMPFTKQLEKLANFIVRDKKGKGSKGTLLDERLISTVPSFAVANAFDVDCEMCELSRKAFSDAMGLLDNYNEKTADAVTEMEGKLDIYEDQLGTYMVKLSKRGASDSDSKRIAKILHTINDFERIGDHAENLVGVAREMHDKGIVFSHEAKAEIEKLSAALHEILDMTAKAFKTSDVQLASSVEPLEQVIDKLISEIKNRHVERLQKGNCTIELGFVLTDLLTNYERVSDHCSNVAVAVLESKHGTFETHEYLNNIRSDGTGSFGRLYEEYSERYSI